MRLWLFKGKEQLLAFAIPLYFTWQLDHRSIKWSFWIAIILSMLMKAAHTTKELKKTNKQTNNAEEKYMIACEHA